MPGFDSIPAKPVQQFNTTHWTMVLKAQDTSSPDSEEALERLCRDYWRPLYYFARRKGNSPEDAQDLVQGYFAKLLEKKYLKDADRERGRFRTFLLSSFSHFMANEWDKQSRLKRGGAVPSLSIDAADAEGSFPLLPVEHFTPERLFDRAWAQTVVDTVFLKLREEFMERGEGERFHLLHPALMGGELDGYKEIGARIELSEAGVKTFVRRLRLRFRDLLRDELRHTLDDPLKVDEEIRHLLAALKS
jgi:RNA polymerase sigma factor (sigma-70 family)